MTTQFYSRPSDVYLGEAGLPNRTKYQDASNSSPKKVISSAAVDGDINYVIDALNALYDTAISGTVPDGSVTNVKFAAGTGGAIKAYNAGGTAVTDLAPSATAGLPLTSAGTAAVPTYAQLTSAGIANNAVTSDKIVNGAITTDKLSSSIQYVPTGGILYFMRSTAPTSYIIADGKTIGGASSGATGRANADTQALFELLWAEFDNTLLPIQDSAGAASTRGASAMADFAANKRLPVFDLRGEFLRGSDLGRGVDSGRALGSAQLDAFQGHEHTVRTRINAGGDTSYLSREGGSTTIETSDAFVSITTDGTNGTPRIAAETRPRNIAALPCIKL